MNENSSDWSKPAGPDYAIDEPEFMAEFGRALAEWGNIEHKLSDIFAVSLQAKDRLNARAAFHAIASFRDRINAIGVVIDRLSERQSTKQWEQIKVEWKRASEAVQKASKNRNKLAHMHVWHSRRSGTFGADDITKVAYLPRDLTERQQAVVTIQKMKDYRKSFCSLKDRLRAFREVLEVGLQNVEAYDEDD